jgi:hypothetical protein
MNFLVEEMKPGLSEQDQQWLHTGSKTNMPPTLGSLRDQTDFEERIASLLRTAYDRADLTQRTRFQKAIGILDTQFDYTSALLVRSLDHIKSAWTWRDTLLLSEGMLRHALILAAFLMVVLVILMNLVSK